MGAPLSICVKLFWNAFIDWLVGLVPFFGDIFDVSWKANQKNIAILQSYFENSR